DAARDRRQQGAQRARHARRHRPEGDRGSAAQWSKLRQVRERQAVRMNRPRLSISAHRHSCWRKIRHRTQYDAQKAAKKIVRRKDYDGMLLKTYECTVCGGWHVGHAKE